MFLAAKIVGHGRGRQVRAKEEKGEKGVQNSACLGRRITLFPPRTKMVTALWRLVPSMTSMRSLVVPNTSSRTLAAHPSLSALNSWEGGKMQARTWAPVTGTSEPQYPLTLNQVAKFL